MNFKLSTDNFISSSREFMPAVILVSGTLAWFFLFQINIDSIYDRFILDASWKILTEFLFYASSILSAIIGSIISKKTDYRMFLITWISLGLFSTFSMAFFQGLMFAIIISILLGVSFGLGLPSSMAFIADSVKIEKRGRIAGTTILLTFILAFLVLAMDRLIGESTIGLLLLATIVRSVSYFGLIQKKPKNMLKNRIALSKLQHGERLKNFGLYIIPWLIFTVSAGLAWYQVPTSTDYSFAINLGSVTRYMLIAIFGFIWGIIADSKGRKQPIIIGLASLGAGFALLGFAMSPISVLVYLSLAGVAWGAFFTMYLIIPGDLAPLHETEKFYAIGTILPLILLFGLLNLPEDIAIIFSNSSFSQILSLLLFISIIPILLAKETLTESAMQHKEMTDYVEKVGKTLQQSNEET